MNTVQDTVAELKQVTKKFGKTVAVNGVDLVVRRGELLAVLGPNGAGKTTVINLLLGLVHPDEGHVRVFDAAPGKTAVRRRLGAMLQVSGVPETLKVHELVRLFRAYYPNPRGQQETLSIAGIEAFADRYFGKLSGGQKQRVMFALAICGNPELLYLDEPTVGLDVSARRAFWDVIRRLRDDGTAVVLTTHYLEEADALADRVVVMDHGRVAAEGSSAAIKKLAANKRIRCRTSLNQAALEALSGVVSVARLGDGWELICQSATPALRALIMADPDVSGLEVTGAGLEQAFLTLVEHEERAA